MCVYGVPARMCSHHPPSFLGYDHDQDKSVTEDQYFCPNFFGKNTWYDKAVEGVKWTCYVLKDEVIWTTHTFCWKSVYYISINV